jgi:dienelactone hydrolase
MPIRLWGTIAAPATAGPHPVVIVAHGAHGDHCPGEPGAWPCFAREQRNDLGLRYLVRALAQAGFVAFAPDLNAAYTEGFGAYRNQERVRFAQVLDTMLVELGKANRSPSSRFGIPLRGKIRLGRLGLLGHSRGGMSAVDWATGKRAVASLLAVAPFHDASTRIGDVPATVVVGTCDGAAGLSGARYFTALRGTARRSPAYLLTLVRATHNNYNRTLVRLRLDDPAYPRRCPPARRLTAPQQQSWLTRVARDHFRVSLLGASVVSWMRTPSPTQLYGRTVTVQRLVP